MRVDCEDPEAARRAEREALAVADRLEAILSAYRPESPYHQWRCGLLRRPPVEVVEVLELAASWHRRTNGAFNPCLGSIMRRWAQAEVEQRLPDRGELTELATQAASLPYVVHDGDVVAVGDCGAVDVHGIAKGWVIDRMVEAVLAIGDVTSVLVDLGGDVRQGSTAGDEFASVAIENPFTVADNAEPLAIVRLSNHAIATSGGGRRGWRIDGRWYGHLLDPARGWPLAHQRSCSVIAPGAADADAAASACAVLDAEAAASLSSREHLAVLVVAENGRLWRGGSWVRDVVEHSVHGDPQQQ